MIEQKVLRVLEFEKMIHLLTEQAVGVIGKEIASQLVPSYTLEDILEQLNETEQAATLYRVKGLIPLEREYDIRQPLMHLDRGGYASAQELLMIADTLRIARR